MAKGKKGASYKGNVHDSREMMPKGKHMMSDKEMAGHKKKMKKH